MSTEIDNLSPSEIAIWIRKWGVHDLPAMWRRAARIEVALFGDRLSSGREIDGNYFKSDLPLKRALQWVPPEKKRSGKRLEIHREWLRVQARRRYAKKKLTEKQITTEIQSSQRGIAA